MDIKSGELFSVASYFMRLVKGQSPVNIEFAGHHELQRGPERHWAGFVVLSDLVDNRNEVLCKLNNNYCALLQSEFHHYDKCINADSAASYLCFLRR